MTGVQVSLSDELAVRDLPVESHELVKRLYEAGRLGVALGLSRDDRVSGPSQLAKAYQAGFNDAVDEISTPDECSDRCAQRAVERMLKDGEL